LVYTLEDFAPFITAQPGDRSVFEGRTAVFIVQAFGTGSLDYQWFYNDDALPGETGPVLTLDNVQLDQSGIYRVEVANMIGMTPARAGG
jgi:hypothetical protein